MFSRRRGAEIVVSPEGLAKLVQDLHWNCEGLYSAAHGPTINVFAQTSGNFLVKLDAHQTDTLRKAVRSYEFSDVYGPR
jgi:hypothetical protein